MPEPNNLALQFLPWVRQGLAAGIRLPDSLNTVLETNATVDVKLWINQATSSTPDVSKTVRLYGPADVTSIDRRQIIRTTPTAFATNFEPNFFPAIEFDRPDFPWLFTPLKADANDRLRPWIVLVTVKKRPGVKVQYTPGASLPQLEINSPASGAEELPDLTESWAWAHAQVATDKDVSIEKALQERPDRTLSRLLCPRRLEPETAYIACVVPAFVTITENNVQRLRAAWDGSATAVSLPVYYSWEFSTGRPGDFETLIERLKPQPLPPEVGKLKLDFGHAGAGLPTLDGAILSFTGVLEPVTAALPDDPRLRLFRAEIGSLLNLPANLTATTALPVVAPPIYGSVHWQGNDPARPPKVDTAQQNLWLNELNLDPRHRVAAGLGTQVIQHEQEELMAAAWEQLERIQEENKAILRRQLAQNIRNTIFENQFKPMQIAPESQPTTVQVRESLLQITGPAHTRMSATSSNTTVTFYDELRKQQTSEFASPALRRITRPRGALSRRFPAPPAATTTTTLKDPIPRQLLKLAPPDLSARARILIRRTRPVGIVTTRKVQQSGIFGGPQFELLTPSQVEQSSAHIFTVMQNEQAVHVIPDGAPASNPVRKNFIAAALQQQARLHRPTKLTFIKRPDIKFDVLLTRLDPQKVSKTLPGTARRALSGNELLTLQAYPEFPQPMYQTLRDLHSDFLLPGLDKVPPDSVQLLQTNQKFIEAFLVGLNHEMSRELIWREFPADLRGTYFRQFWESSNTTINATPAIHLWQQALGKNTVAAQGGSGGNQLVLLIRSELLRRYPGAIIYAVKADASGRTPSKLAADVRYPTFRGSAPPDITFIGFGNLTREEIRQPIPGWFFIIQQQPGEPYFGFDEGNGFDATPARDWNELSWHHFARSQSELQQIRHVSLRPSVNQLPNLALLPKPPEWGKNAAHMARITFQKPVRIAIHASLLLPANN